MSGVALPRAATVLSRSHLSLARPHVAGREWRDRRTAWGRCTPTAIFGNTAAKKQKANRTTAIVPWTQKLQQNSAVINLLGLLLTVSTLLVRAGMMEANLNDRLDGVDKRFSSIDARFTQIDTRFTQLEGQD